MFKLSCATCSIDVVTDSGALRPRCVLVPAPYRLPPDHVVQSLSLRVWGHWRHTRGLIIHSEFFGPARPTMPASCRYSWQNLHMPQRALYCVASRKRRR